MRVAIVGLIGLAIASPALAQPEQVSHGDYLVNRVMLCGDCHSPRGPHGEPMPGGSLSGAPFPGGPPHPTPNFATYAPSIRGLPPGYTQAALARLMETGEKPDGSHPRRPMPPFRLKPADAQAVAAYLASLKQMDDAEIDEMFAALGPVTIKRLFGGKGVYRLGLILAVQFRGEMLLKADEVSAPEFEAAGAVRWTYEGRKGQPVAMPYWSIPQDAYDDPEIMARWVRLAYEAATRAAAA